jgi:hypothetical protein
MAAPVVHFEIVGRDAERLRSYFAALFGWEYDTTSPVAEEVSDAGAYGFVDLLTTPDGTGIRGGVGGGPGPPPRAAGVGRGAASAVARATRRGRCSTSGCRTSKRPWPRPSAWAETG